MSVKLNNVYFKLNGVSYTGGIIKEGPSIGQVFRVANVSSTESGSFTYTKIDGTSASTSVLTSGSIEYILVKFGSLNDQVYGSPIFLAITNLLITSSTDQSFSFTEEIISTVGSGNWTKPTGVTEVIVECWGGGGAGGGATTNGNAGSGGGGGSYARKLITYSSAQSTISYNIASSTAGTTGNGDTGGDTTWNTNEVIAKGSTGGLANDYNGIDIGTGTGSFQPGSVGNVIYTGTSGNGSGPGRGGVQSGQGGNGAPSCGDSTYSFEYGGSGGVAISEVSSNGDPGQVAGGGGSGGIKLSGANRTGGTGAQGAIRLIYR
jgi:hypothetical protein